MALTCSTCRCATERNTSGWTLVFPSFQAIPIKGSKSRSPDFKLVESVQLIPSRSDFSLFHVVSIYVYICYLVAINIQSNIHATGLEFKNRSACLRHTTTLNNFWKKAELPSGYLR